MPDKDFDRKIELLKEAGLIWTCLALQSGSPDINRRYNRVFDKERILKAARKLKDLDIGFYTDVITYSPFETRDDLERTLEVLVELPQPYDICVNKLYVAPGTELSKGIKSVVADGTDIFDYYSALFWIASYFKRSKGIVGAVKSIGLLERYRMLRTLFLAFFHLMGNMNRICNKLRALKRTGRLSTRVRQVLGAKASA
jgi:hypothetical protein